MKKYTHLMLGLLEPTYYSMILIEQYDSERVETHPPRVNCADGYRKISGWMYSLLYGWISVCWRLTGDVAPEAVSWSWVPGPGKIIILPLKYSNNLKYRQKFIYFMPANSYVNICNFSYSYSDLESVKRQVENCNERIDHSSEVKSSARIAFTNLSFQY